MLNKNPSLVKLKIVKAVDHLGNKSKYLGDLPDIKSNASSIVLIVLYCSPLIKFHLLILQLIFI